MSFTIVRTNGTVLAVIQDGELNTTSTPLFLPGRNYPGYGSVIDTNFVHQLENFAFQNPPGNALQGQLWYNTTVGSEGLYVCPIDGESDPNNWIRLMSADSALDLTAGNLTLTGNINANNGHFTNTVAANLVDTDYLNVNVQANIANANITGNTVVANLNTANITTGSNTTAGALTGAWSLNGTLNSNGNVTALGFKSDNYRYANGQLINFVSASGSNGEVQFKSGSGLSSSPDFTFNSSNSSIYLIGNIEAVNFTALFGGVFTGDGSGLSNIAASGLAGTLSPSVQGNITQLGALSSLTVTGSINTANVFAANNVSAARLTGSLTTASQPNVTSVGTLTSLNVSSKVTAGQLEGDGGNISNIQAANISGTVASATYAATAGSVSGPAPSATTAITVTGNAQPNISSLGVLSSLAVTGNVTAGNVYANSGTIGAILLNGTLTTAAQPNITSLGTITGLTSTGNITAPYFIGNVQGNISGNLSIAGVNTGVVFNDGGQVGTSSGFTFNKSTTALTLNGALTATSFSGSGSGLTSIPGANVSGTVASATSAGSATTAGTVTTSAQPNITSVGTLSSLAVTGTATAGNLSTGGNLSVTGNVNFSGSNVTLGSASTVRITGGSSGYVLSTNGSGGLSWVPTGTATTAATVTSNAQPNITSVGTMSYLDVSGAVTAGNVYANSGTVRGSLLTGTLTTSSQPNVTQLGPLSSLTVLGNINAANVAANHFGSGSGLTNINGANVSGAVANATYATTAGSVASIPAGTAMLFVQTTAPTGWTKVTSYDNAALRVVSGSAGSGGTVNFTTAFSAKNVTGTVGGTSLTESQMPAHTHLTATNIKVNSGSVAPFSSSYYLARETDIGGDTEYNLQATYTPPNSLQTSSAGSGDPHTHTFSGSSIDLAVKYVDTIIAVKN